MTKLKMKSSSGFIVSEYVTAVLAIVVTLGVGFGVYVSYERDNMVKKAQLSLAEIKARTDAAVENGVTIICDNSMVESDLLDNAFIPLSIRPIQIDQRNRNMGFSAGVTIKSNREEDGNDRFISADRLQKALEKDEGYLIRWNMQDEDNIAYSVLMSDIANCSTS